MNIERPTPKMKIPKDSKKVFNGVIHDVYHWDQEMFDGSKKIYEGVKRNDSANIICITKDKKIVILDEEQVGLGKFKGVPAGAAEDGENILAAAKRELIEETGYTSDKWTRWFVHQPSSKIDWFVYTFIARDAQKSFKQNLDPGEKVAKREVSFEQFMDISLQEDFRDFEISYKVMEAKLYPHKMKIIKELFFA